MSTDDDMPSVPLGLARDEIAAQALLPVKGTTDAIVDRMGAEHHRPSAY